MATIYDFTALSNKGKEVNLSDYKGQVILIVNTASPATSSPTRNRVAMNRSRSSAVSTTV